MTTVVYIAGYGRSGSTVLSAVLGSHPNIMSGGELVLGPEEWFDANRICACGLPYAECDFWSDLLRDPRIRRAADRTVRSTERLTRLPLLGLGLISRSRRDAYRQVQSHILGHITARSGKQVVVDASKSARYAAGRALALSRLAGYDVRLIHLVRDGRRALESLRRTGSNRALEGLAVAQRPSAIRACVGWLRSNACAHLFRTIEGPDRYIRLRYEDFIADPTTQLRRLGSFLGLDMTPVLDRIAGDGRFPVGHMVGGNRIRLERWITLRPAPANVVPPDLTRGERALFAAACGWLNRRYGYDAA